jgi:TRAP transporter 4TM/12TM fusion protein
MTRLRHSNIHLGLFLVIFYLTTIEFEPEDWRDHLNNLLTIVLTLGTIIVAVYVHTNFDRLLGPVSQLLLYTDVDLLIGGLIILIAMHATWRAYGATLGVVVLGSLVYGHYGHLFPWILQHGGISLEQLIFINAISLDGVYGFILGVGSTWVVIFILFAGFIEGYGGIDFIIEKAGAVSGKVRSGVLQTAVASSMLVGSIMGSSAANVATTGSFTIPLMKDHGVEAKNAAAIESIASTAGQMLPPVMGSAAFLMADIIGIPFFDVLQGATIPALLFYFTTGVTVYLLAIKHDWGLSDSASKEEENTKDSEMDSQSLVGRARSLAATLFDGSPYIIAFVFLVYLLAVLRYSPLTAGLYSIVILPPLALARDLGNDGFSMGTFVQWGRNTIESCRIGAVNMAPLTAVLASLGVVVRIVNQTGLAQRITFEMNAIAGTSFFLVLLAAMVISILFGMGMPTAAAYIVVAILTAPTLVAVGINQLTAHIFVFYFAMLSTITPPIALSCAVGAGIADAKFWDVAIQTLRLGLFAFLLPFVFVMNEELVIWSASTPVTALAAAVGLVMMALAVVGYDNHGSLSAPKRVGYLAIAAAIFFIPFAQVPLAALMVLWLVYLLKFDESVLLRVSRDFG